MQANKLIWLWSQKEQTNNWKISIVSVKQNWSTTQYTNFVKYSSTGIYSHYINSLKKILIILMSNASCRHFNNSLLSFKNNSLISRIQTTTRTIYRIGDQIWVLLYKLLISNVPLCNLLTFGRTMVAVTVTIFCKPFSKHCSHSIENNNL